MFRAKKVHVSDSRWQQTVDWIFLTMYMLKMFEKGKKCSDLQLQRTAVSQTVSNFFCQFQNGSEILCNPKLSEEHLIQTIQSSIFFVN